jgi:hypothetical protein
MVAVMTNALREGVPIPFDAGQRQRGMRESSALIILRYVDQGEHDPVRLADSAILELEGSERGATGCEFPTGEW